MNNDQQFWLATSIGVTIALIAAIIQVGLSTGWSNGLIGQGILFGLGGASGIYFLRTIVHHFAAESEVSRLRRYTIRGVVLGIVLGACAYAVWAVTRPPESSSAPEAPTQSNALAQLLGGEWAQEGESCERDSIRFAAEGEVVVAYPKGAPSIRFRVERQVGQQITTYRNDSIVVFELRGDGFTYFEGGQARWYRRCG